MNLFKDPKPTTLAAKRNLLDASETIHLQNSQLVNYVRRLDALAHMMGGPYPAHSSEEIPAAPENVVDRLFYDLDVSQVLLNELGHHLQQLENVVGIPTQADMKSIREVPSIGEGSSPARS